MYIYSGVLDWNLLRMSSILNNSCFYRFIYEILLPSLCHLIGITIFYPIFNCASMFYVMQNRYQQEHTPKHSDLPCLSLICCTSSLVHRQLCSHMCLLLTSSIFQSTTLRVFRYGGAIRAYQWHII
jgi:hypothetical protein